ncbi:MAG: 30S ribosomal protein S16 [Candidatus Moraniibacteriota bacterium]|nr:MAG: 30S ribosomal protein S16 [Candidatus Moranbacteria bacterium]
MLTIRFNRTGRKNRPSYRVVLQEHTVAPGGRHVEVLGSYDPYSKQTLLKRERIQHWIERGAQPSDTAHNLLVREGILTEGKRAVKMPKPVAKEAPTEAVEAKVEMKAEKGETEKSETEAKA